MNKTVSLYLDFIRFTAALLVFFFHAKYDRFDGYWLSSVGKYGHEAVIIFFVLSGFVIAYVSSTKERTFSDYSISRLSRLYSVVFPALILTITADYIGKILDPSMYAGGHYQDSKPVFRFLSNMFFVNEIWFESYRPFSNGAFWSLSYEFWYYVIFAAYFYSSGWWKYILPFIAALIAGPKIVLLLPVWVFGVLVYQVSQKISFSRDFGWVLFLLPVLVYLAIRELGIYRYLLHETIDYFGRDFVYQDLRWSRRFIYDYIIGLLFSIHIVGLVAIASNGPVSKKLERPIKYLAGSTFSLYLFHYPLLQLFGSMFDEGLFIVISTFITVLFLAPFTEGRKHSYRLAIERLFHLKKDPPGELLRNRSVPNK